MKAKEREMNLNFNIFNIDEILTNNYEIEKKREKDGYVEYLDIIASFDIETSSFEIYGTKSGCMYIWMLCIEGKVTIGRTWEEFTTTINKIVDFYKLNENRRLIIYIHNLAFEFQWFCKYFEWLNVFARDKRKPMKALTTLGIEFKCSYILSGCSLEKIAEDLTKYKVKKLVGNLDYTLIRTSKTELTKDELNYCINDVLVIVAYIKEQIEYYGKITTLPLTNTGRVRKLCKKQCFNSDNYNKYKELMKRLILNDKEYLLLKNAFSGGFTHANWLFCEDIKENVKSFDFTSSYPTVMISEKYPCTRGEKIKTTIEEIERDKNLYCFVFNIRFKNIRPRLYHENYISKSKCWELKKSKENNGRIISAELLTTTITEVDYFIIKDFYEWDSCEVGQCYRYRKAYLPSPIVNIILDLYEDKTTLKDVEGKEFEYQLKKGMLNSMYGMICMDVSSDEIYYDSEWESEKADLKECIKQYNNDKSRFLFYPWALYVTAYSRRNLFYAIKECKDDYIYSDTDSIKITNFEKYIPFFERYNKWITERLERACKFHGFDVERLRPRTIKGKQKPLGVWDDDGFYTKFKTLGAKRYLVEINNEKIKATVAGINKTKLAEYLNNMVDDGFSYFSDNMFIPASHSGKITASYFDEKQEGIIRDYKGQEFYYKELSGVNMGISDYRLGISELYRILLNSKMEVKYGII